MDQAIPLRDGKRLYTDAFRPVSKDEKYWAILPWNPYGKVASRPSIMTGLGPWRIGIPYKCLRGYETFEVSRYRPYHKAPNTKQIHSGDQTQQSSAQEATLLLASMQEHVTILRETLYFGVNRFVRV